MKTIKPGARIRPEGPSKNSRQTTDALLSPRGQVGGKIVVLKELPKLLMPFHCFEIKIDDLF